MGADFVSKTVESWEEEQLAPREIKRKASLLDRLKAEIVGKRIYRYNKSARLACRESPGIEKIKRENRL